MFGGPIRRDTIEGEASARSERRGNRHLFRSRPVAPQFRLGDWLSLGHRRYSLNPSLRLGPEVALVAALGAAEAAVVTEQTWTIGSIVCADQPRGEFHFHEVEPAGSVICAYIPVEGTWEARGSYLYTFFPYF